MNGHFYRKPRKIVYVLLFIALFAGLALSNTSFAYAKSNQSLDVPPPCIKDRTHTCYTPTVTVDSWTCPSNFSQQFYPGTDANNQSVEYTFTNHFPSPCVTVTYDLSHDIRSCQYQIYIPKNYYADGNLNYIVTSKGRPIPLGTIDENVHDGWVPLFNGAYQSGLTSLSFSDNTQQSGKFLGWGVSIQYSLKGVCLDPHSIR